METQNMKEKVRVLTHYINNFPKDSNITINLKRIRGELEFLMLLNKFNVITGNLFIEFALGLLRDAKSWIEVAKTLLNK